MPSLSAERRPDDVLTLMVMLPYPVGIKVNGSPQWEGPSWRLPLISPISLARSDAHGGITNDGMHMGLLMMSSALCLYSARKVLELTN